MRYLLRILLILAYSLPLSAAAKSEQKPKSEKPILPLKVTEKTLANGLHVVIVPTGFPNLVSIHIPVKTGSRNEVEAGKTGFAHFFEHMMFRGTKTMSSEVYQSYLTRMGARQNAYTTNDYTNYYTSFSKEDLELMLKIEADRFQNLEYSESAFKTEARAVLGEYNKNAANPIIKLFESMQDAAFQKHTYKHTTMGFLKDIEDMPNQFAYSKVFFDRWYRPENTSIILAGDVQADKVLPLIEKYWGSWQRGKYQVEIPQEPKAEKAVYTHVSWKTATLPHLALAFRGPGFSVKDKDYAALDLYFDLAFGSSSDLYKKLVLEEQKLNSLNAGASSSQDPNLFSIIGILKDHKDITYVRNEFMKTLAQGLTESFSQERLDQVRGNIRYSFTRRLDNTESIASTLATFVRYDRRFATLNEYYAALDQIKGTDINQALKRYLNDQNLVLASLSKETLPEDLKTLPPLTQFQRKAPTLAQIPTITQQSQLPLMNIKVMFRVGSAQDPVGKEGLAYLASSMITDAGSKKYSYDELQKILFPLAIGFDHTTDKELTTFTIQTHQDHFATVIQKLLPSLTDPGLREDDFQRLKSLQLSALKNNLRSNNEEELAKERLQEIIMKGSRLAHPVIGTVQSLEAIQLQDVRDFIAKAYAQNNMTLGISGPVRQEETLAIQTALSTLPKASSLAAQSKLRFTEPKGLAVEIIQKTTRSTAISFGKSIEVNRSHPDFAALWLARSWLGEHRSSMSHLYERIREVRGLNYGDYAYIEAFPGAMYSFFPSPNIARQHQIFEVWLRPVMPQNAHHTLRIALYELENLISKGLTPAQFEKTREYLMKNVYLMTATQNQQLGYALDSQFYGIGEFTSTMRQELQKLTVEKVNQAIQRHLSSENLHIVMVTEDAEGLKKQILSDAPSSLVYDGEKPKELLDEDKLIGSRKLGISAKAVTITPIDEVFRDQGRILDTARHHQ